MKRYFFIEDDLDDLELIERQLLSSGMSRPQVHVLSRDDVGVSEHDLNEVHALLRHDTIHSGVIGALIGLVVSVVSIVLAYISGLMDSIGWLPFAMLSVVLLGFFTWEGGLFGIQMPNSQFRRFEDALRSGKHLLLVDVDRGQEYIMQKVLSTHPHVQSEGTGVAAPRWLMRWQQRWSNFLQWAP